MMCHVTGYELGELGFNINDCHIYDRHLDVLLEQINLPDYPAPTLHLNPEKKSFYDFTIEDFVLENYQHGPFLKMEVAV